MKKITIKQEQFINFYFQTLNGTESAYRVYNCKTRASASQIAYRLLRNVEILTLIRNKIKAGGLSLESITETAIKSLVEIAKRNPDRVNASESLRANELLLKLQGYL